MIQEFYDICVDTESKQSVWDFLHLDIPVHKSGNFICEYKFKHYFPELYDQICITDFPDDISFKEKVWHFLQDDLELKMGRCKTCGSISSFISFNRGYRDYCSHSCYTSDDMKPKHTREINAENIQKKSESLRKFYENPDNRKMLSDSIRNSEKYQHVVHLKSHRENISKSMNKFYENLQNRDNMSATMKKSEVHKKVCGSEEFKQRVSRGILNSETFKSVMQSDDYRNKMSDIQKEYFSHPENRKNRSQSLKKSERFKQSIVCNTRKEKEYETRRKNGTFNTSKIETQLKTYFTEHGVNYISQYRDLRYPFNCDFYFPESDLFVEIQGSWTHGGHPFNPDVDLTIVQQWLEKNSKFYDNAIDTWIIRDVKKRETAGNNNLNYLEIFSIDFKTCVETILTKIAQSVDKY